jgi:two-component system NarL family sensor kinase
VDEAVKEVRSISHNMMPNALIRSGLSTALREFINKISSTGALKIDLEIIGLNERMESTTETVLYRVLQECISNIVKHAKASKIGIQLVKHTTSLNLIIEDNGVGFDSSKINDFTGIGLKNIISRVQFLNGNVEFDSFPGNGTTVVIDIPL